MTNLNEFETTVREFLFDCVEVSPADFGADYDVIADLNVAPDDLVYCMGIFEDRFEIKIPQDLEKVVDKAKMSDRFYKIKELLHLANDGNFRSIDLEGIRVSELVKIARDKKWPRKRVNMLI